ncbi:hypothetical protein [Chryseobacterium flavum]|uniref:hypothetical protein n=1 Tax=Chryseobacterium flavum TaxID=415851 RepID=UPI0028A95F44|nr:hypothetical protein [Chryseobacterium flavum]
MGKVTTENKATPLTEEQLSAKEAELKSQSKNLAQEIEKFEKEKQDFKDHVATETQKLSEGFADLEEKKKAFDNKVAQLSEAPEKEKESVEPLKCTFNDEEYQFSEDAPELILFDGKGWTHQEIIENEDVLLQIIGGGLGLIKKI